MSDSDDELRVLRERIAQLEDALDRVPVVTPTERSMLVTTTTETSYPVAAAAYYAVQQTNPGGDEVEGGAATSTIVDGIFYAWNRGTAIPPDGTEMLADEAGGRWTIEFNG